MWEAHRFRLAYMAFGHWDLLFGIRYRRVYIYLMQNLSVVPSLELT